MLKQESKEMWSEVSYFVLFNNNISTFGLVHILDLYKDGIDLKILVVFCIMLTWHKFCM